MNSGAQPVEARIVRQHGQRHDAQRADDDEQARDPRSGSARRGARPTCARRVGLQHVGDEPERHADAGGAEAPVPAIGRIEAAGAEPALEGIALRQEAGHQRREEAADVDAHVEDREAGVAALVAGRIEPADHGADVGLEQAGADRDQRQADVERGLRRHRQREMPAGDDARRRSAPRSARRDSGRRCSRRGSTAGTRPSCSCRRCAPPRPSSARGRRPPPARR